MAASEIERGSEFCRCILEQTNIPRVRLALGKSVHLVSTSTSIGEKILHRFGNASCSMHRQRAQERERERELPRGLRGCRCLLLLPVQLVHHMRLLVRHDLSCPSLLDARWCFPKARPLEECTESHVVV